MKQLMQMILALPLTKFRRFLRIKNNMKPNDLVYSILCFKAINQEKPAKEIVEFPDPLKLTLKRFNKDIVTQWNNLRPATASDNTGQRPQMPEEDHLEMVITQFREFDRENFPDLDMLKIKIEALINVYTAIRDGYSTYTLTALLAAVTVVNNEKKTSWLDSWYYKKIPEKWVFENEDILDIYAALHEPDESRLINLLYKIDLECQALNHIMDVYIEGRILDVAMLLAHKISVEEMLLTYTDFKEAISLRETTTMLQACLYDKGKDAIDRLTLFNKIYLDVQKKINMQGNKSTYNGINEFNKNILLLFSASKLQKLTMFSTAPFPVSQVIAAAISNTTNLLSWGRKG